MMAERLTEKAQFQLDFFKLILIIHWIHLKCILISPRKSINNVLPWKCSLETEVEAKGEAKWNMVNGP